MLSMEKLTEFLQMGGFANYVWPAYLITILVMTLVALVSWRSLRKVRRQLEQLKQARP